MKLSLAIFSSILFYGKSCKSAQSLQPPHEKLSLLTMTACSIVYPDALNWKFICALPCMNIN